MLFRKIDTFHLHLSTSFLGVLFKLCKNIINMVLKCIAFPFYLFYIFRYIAPNLLSAASKHTVDCRRTLAKT